MDYKIIVPPLGESVVEGTIVKWIKNEGDRIKIDEPIVEIMTDKINIEIPSPYNGVMKKHLIPINTTVEIGTEIAIMDIEGQAVEAKTFQVKPDAGPERIPQEQEVKPPPEEFVGTMAHHQAMGIHADEEAITAGIDAVKSSPLVRRLAREHFIDLRLVKGSGGDGRISKEDILKYIEMRHTIDIKKPDKPAFVWPESEDEEVIKISGVRKIISEHMTKAAFTIPHVTTFDECDMTQLINWRKQYVEQIEKLHGVRVTYMPFIAKAIIYAAKDYPWVNSTFDGDILKVKKYFNIGMAVARNNSLIVPVVKHCEQKSLLQIGKEMKALADKANADKLGIDEITGGTFTITNAGVYGALASTPIIAYPQVAILGVHKIVEKPVVRDGQIVIRPIMTLGMSFDHRVVDGGYAVQFLRKMIEYLEDPQGWLIGVM
jgi:2-oxoglutarate dehydrogenase complex dihydrolipoamide succinyltransferase (E2) component